MSVRFLRPEPGVKRFSGNKNVTHYTVLFYVGSIDPFPWSPPYKTNRRDEIRIRNEGPKESVDKVRLLSFVMSTPDTSTIHSNTF